MKILVLNGSPRNDSNSSAMIEAFKKGAEGNGNEVTVCDVAKMKIAGCLACEYCHTKGEGACIQKDDMQEVFPLLAEADAIVFASPIYYMNISGMKGPNANQLMCFYQKPLLLEESVQAP